MRVAFCNAISFLLLGTIPVFAWQNTTMSIQGKVIDENHQPVAGATVYVSEVDRPAIARPSRVDTDEMGTFDIPVTAPGRYEIHAFKADTGYPDVVFAFNAFGDQQLPGVTISKDQKVTGVVVKLGPKSGTIHFSVIDARTKESIASVHYKLCQSANPEFCLQGTAPGQHDFLVPPIPISIEVSARGHATETYGQKSGHPFAALRPGEERTLVVTLSAE